MVLGEWAERRRGSGSLQAAAQWQWGDAADWAAKLTSWTSGAATP